MAEIWRCRLCRVQTIKKTPDADPPSCMKCGSDRHMTKERTTNRIDTENWK